MMGQVYVEVKKQAGNDLLSGFLSLLHFTSLHKKWLRDINIGVNLVCYFSNNQVQKFINSG